MRELPGVPTPYTGRGIDLVVVRENVEDLYAGIEYMQTPGVAECLKLISPQGLREDRPAGLRVRPRRGPQEGRLRHQVEHHEADRGLLEAHFEEVAKEYPDIESWHIIVDNCCHQLVKKPEQFDVIVTTNMNGDIMSDLTSAPDRRARLRAVGQPRQRGGDLRGGARLGARSTPARTSSTRRPCIGSAVMMLRHLGEFDAAGKIENAVLVTLEEGKVKTGDVVGYDK